MAETDKPMSTTMTVDTAEYEAMKARMAELEKMVPKPKGKGKTRAEHIAILNSISDIREKAKYAYVHNLGTIQEIARTWRLTVEEVLDYLDMSEMASIDTIGDLIDKDEAGPDATINGVGTPARANFSIN